MLTTVSVRTLAEFLHRRGDLYPPLGGRVTAEQGIAAQRRVQRQRPGSYQREVTVQAGIGEGDLIQPVVGRLDGCDLAASPPLVEEIKTTRADPADAERLLGSAHWAQVRLYAALLARERPDAARWQLRLTYCHPVRDEAASFDRTEDRDTLMGFLIQTLADYRDWVASQAAYATARDGWLSERDFPYGRFRPHQRALAGRVYRALSAGEHLLLEAPTGSGKTMGVMFPALKALAGGHLDRLFYLTSRGTGSLAALKACRDLSTETESIRAVELIAKEKACPVPGMPCDERCPYQLGYYDRIHAAVRELLTAGIMDRATVRAVAERHTVCPFELSLDAASWADLILGDYNYLLDPVVRLQRFAEDGRMGVLVDESHQLADRARGMLSLSLDRTEVRAALEESPPASLARRLKAVDRALLAVRRDFLAEPTEECAKGAGEGGQEGSSVEGRIEPPAALLRAVERALEALSEEDLTLEAYPCTRQLIFNLSRWIRSSAWIDGMPGDAFSWLIQVPGRRRGTLAVTIRLGCLDPGPYIARVLAGYGGHVRFSGTVSPLALYQTLHGTPEAPAERLESPFAAEQLATLVVTDLPVYYRQRARTLPTLADLVADVAAARPGNYLVALPSFEYLDVLANRLLAAHPALAQSRQRPGMSESDREAFLGDFRADGSSRVGLIVLGGVFGESVDFSHAPLAGVVCVGVGLPPVSRLRTEMERYFESRLGPGGGETVAYQQPAMTKVLQMAGRLLRSPDDRGILCLVDDRFGHPAYRRFFPGHWRPETVRASEVGARLASFWQAAAGLPCAVH